MRLLYAAAATVLLAGCTQTLGPEHVKLLAASCETGQKTYVVITAGATAGFVKPVFKERADQIYVVLDGVCKKGSAATQADIVLAGAQVYALTKLWRDAT